MNGDWSKFSVLTVVGAEVATRQPNAGWKNYNVENPQTRLLKTAF